ncbi:MAG: AtpZ/AtpI family protein [Phycisphaeraceae bacterium]|nr:AtpZ/AtpI family protein [Phycisphaeraceae bacterium]
MSQPPPIPPELREDAPLPQQKVVWTPRAEAQRRASGQAGAMDALVKVGAVSLNFVYAVAGLALIGWVIDYFAGTGRLWLLIGAGLGLVAGAYRFVVDARRMLGGKGK